MCFRNILERKDVLINSLVIMPNVSRQLVSNARGRARGESQGREPGESQGTQAWTACAKRPSIKGQPAKLGGHSEALSFVNKPSSTNNADFKLSSDTTRLHHNARTYSVCLFNSHIICKPPPPPGSYFLIT